MVLSCLIDVVSIDKKYFDDLLLINYLLISSVVGITLLGNNIFFLGINHCFLLKVYFVEILCKFYPKRATSLTSVHLEFLVNSFSMFVFEIMLKLVILDFKSSIK